MGKGYQPSGQPPSRKTTLSLVSILRPVQHGWPYQESKTPADTALCVIETRKPLHHGKVVVPLEWNLFNEHHGIRFLLGNKKKVGTTQICRQLIANLKTL